MSCEGCQTEAEELPFRCWFCGKQLCGDCADADGTCRTHPEAAGLSDQQIVECMRETRKRGN